MLIKQKFRNRLPDFLKIQNRAHSQGINKVFIVLFFGRITVSSGKKFSDHKVYNSRPLNHHQMSKNEVFPILYYSLVSSEHTILIWFGKCIKFYFSQ